MQRHAACILTVGAKAAAEPARARTAVALASIVGGIVKQRRGVCLGIYGLLAGEKLTYFIRVRNPGRFDRRLIVLGAAESCFFFRIKS